MMRLFLNCLAASAGGGLTYVHNVIPHFAARPHVHAVIAVTPQVRELIGDPGANVSIVTVKTGKSAGTRFFAEQRLLPDLIRKHHAELLISAGNFALWRSPVPQILLAGNSLYTSADFSRDLRARGEYRMWLDTRLRAFIACQSVRRADCTITPSTAFRHEIVHWGGNVVAVHHGFDPKHFFADNAPVPEDIRAKLESAERSFKLLFVSHYNYYRNFETLLRALPTIVKSVPQRRVQLFLTCALKPGANPGAYRTEQAAALVQRLGISSHVIEFGALPYHRLHHVYRACDLYVTPAYAETFAHPLVEAMASGLPIVASDLPVHREVCGDAAEYFPRFSPEDLARTVVELGHDEGKASRMSQLGLQRSAHFSWGKHVDEILRLASSLTAPSHARRHFAPEAA